MGLMLGNGISPCFFAFLRGRVYDSHKIFPTNMQLLKSVEWSVFSMK